MAWQDFLASIASPQNSTSEDAALQATQVDYAKRQNAAAALGVQGNGSEKQGLLSQVLSLVDKPRAAVFATGKELSDVLGNQHESAGNAASDWWNEFSGHQGDGYEHGIGDLQGLKIEDGDNFLTRAEKKAGAFVGDTLSDPITYLTLGTGALAKTGAEGLARLAPRALSVAEEKLGPEVVDKLFQASKGVKTANLERAGMTADEAAQAGHISNASNFANKLDAIKTTLAAPAADGTAGLTGDALDSAARGQLVRSEASDHLANIMGEGFSTTSSGHGLSDALKTHFGEEGGATLYNALREDPEIGKAVKTWAHGAGLRTPFGNKQFLEIGNGSGDLLNKFVPEALTNKVNDTIFKAQDKLSPITTNWIGESGKKFGMVRHGLATNASDLDRTTLADVLFKKDAATEGDKAVRAEQSLLHPLLSAAQETIKSAENKDEALNAFKRYDDNPNLPITPGASQSEQAGFDAARKMDEFYATAGKSRSEIDPNFNARGDFGRPRITTAEGSKYLDEVNPAQAGEQRSAKYSSKAGRIAHLNPIIDESGDLALKDAPISTWNKVYADRVGEGAKFFEEDPFKRAQMYLDQHIGAVRGAVENRELQKSSQFLRPGRGAAVANSAALTDFGNAASKAAGVEGTNSAKRVAQAQLNAQSRGVAVNAEIASEKTAITRLRRELTEANARGDGSAAAIEEQMNLGKQRIKSLTTEQVSFATQAAESVAAQNVTKAAADVSSDLLSTDDRASLETQLSNLERLMESKSVVGPMDHLYEQASQIRQRLMADSYAHSKQIYAQVFGKQITDAGVRVQVAQQVADKAGIGTVADYATESNKYMQLSAQLHALLKVGGDGVNELRAAADASRARLQELAPQVATTSTKVPVQKRAAAQLIEARKQQAALIVSSDKLDNRIDEIAAMVDPEKQGEAIAGLYDMYDSLRRLIPDSTMRQLDKAERAILKTDKRDIFTLSNGAERKRLWDGAGSPNGLVQLGSEDGTMLPGAFSGVMTGRGMKQLLETDWKLKNQPGALNNFYTSIVKPYDNAWRTWVTVGRGVGYMVPNIEGGLWNSYLIGVRGRHILDSGKITKAWSGATLAARKAPDSEKLKAFDDALESRLKNVTLHNGVNAHEAVKLYRGLLLDDNRTLDFLKKDAAETAQSAMERNKAEITDAVGRMSGLKGKAAAKGAKAANAITDNAYIHASTTMNQHAELFTRLPSFLLGLEQGGANEMGAHLGQLNVALSQFMYQDLSDTERTLRKYIPFLTWTSRNVPLQIRSMIGDPAKFLKYTRAMDAVQGTFSAPDQDQSMLPAWLQQQKGFASMFHYGNNPLAFYAKLPANDVDQLLTAPTSWKGAIDPRQWINLRQAGSSLNPIQKTGIEQVFGVNTFTGASGAPTGQKTIANLVPPLGLLDRLSGGAVSDASGVQNDQKERLLSNWLSTGLGAPVATVTPSQQAGELVSRDNRLAAAIKSAAGSNIDTAKLSAAVGKGYSVERLQAMAAGGKFKPSTKTSKGKSKPLPGNFSTLDGSA